MAEASIDIRIFENKEMKAVDMAELMDAAIFRNGVIQGCESSLNNGVFTIEGGRIVVGGRLGVVTGGTVPNPTTLSRTDTCYPIAVCDLADVNNPFYFMIATRDDLTSLGLDYENRSQNFNVQNGRDALFFGTVEVDPATGLASNYQPWGQATARKGWDWYTTILNEIQRVNNTYADKITWKESSTSDHEVEHTGPKWHRIPEDAKELYITVWVSRSSSNKSGVSFHIPVNDHLFVTSATIMTQANGWPDDSNGFVEIRLLKNTEGRHVNINRVYNGTSVITNSVTWLVLYR